MQHAMMVLILIGAALPAWSQDKQKADIPPPKMSISEAVAAAVKCSSVKLGDASTYGAYYVGGADFSAMPENIDGKMYDRHWRVTLTSSGLGEGALHFVYVFEDGRCESRYGK